MGEFSKFISPTRRTISTPKNLVDEKGVCVFGTFDKEFENMDLLKAKKPTLFPQKMNKMRLTLWEACELNLKNGVLVTVVLTMGFVCKFVTLFYDKRTHKVYNWDNTLNSKKLKVAPTLMNGDTSQAGCKNGFVKIVNNFECGKCSLSGKDNGRCMVNGKKFFYNEKIEYSFELTRVSKPSIVSIPFGENRPLYSQKDLFKVVGSLKINGEEMLSDDESTAIIDDHRGYYPRHSHYDWVTTMGIQEINGVKQWLGVNLTRNQSIDQEQYNENVLWLEDKSYPLPPVTFKQSLECKDFYKKGYAEWHVKDEHDMVNVKLKINGMNPFILDYLVIKSDYYFAFGTLEGYVRDEDGNKYSLDGMVGLGEDKTVKF